MAHEEKQGNIYESVTNFSDLLVTNLKFFNGELKETYYYIAPWGKGENQRNHANTSTNNLIELTEKHRIFTVDGQSSYTDKTTRQRSYLECYIEKDLFDRIKDELLSDPRIITTFIIRHEYTNPIKSFFAEYSTDLRYTINSSIPKGKSIINLTMEDDRPYTNFRIDPIAFEDGLPRPSQYPHIRNILYDTIFCFIVCRDYSTPYTADKILLEHLRRLHKNVNKNNKKKRNTKKNNNIIKKNNNVLV